MTRIGRKAIPTAIRNCSPATVRNARASTLGVKGAKLFNLMLLNLRNNNHGDLLMFKNPLDISGKHSRSAYTGSEKM